MEQDRIEPTLGDRGRSGPDDGDVEFVEVGAGATGADEDDAPQNPVDAYERLYIAHAAAAESGDADQPFLLAARRAAAVAIREDPEMLADMAIRKPQFLVQVDADADGGPDLANEAAMRNLYQALYGVDNWGQLTDEQRAEMADEASAYAHAKSVYGTLTVEQAQAMNDAYRAGAAEVHLPERIEPQRLALLDAHVKRLAAQLADGAGIVRLAAREPELALAACADAGTPRERLTPEAQAALRPAADAYLFADRGVVRSLEAGRWTDYDALIAERREAARPLQGDPVAMAVLGRVSGENAYAIGGKIGSDMLAIKAARDAAQAERFDEGLRRFEQDFLKDLDPTRNDPVSRYAAIQKEILRQEKEGGSGANLAYLDRMSRETALEVATSGTNFARLRERHPQLVERAAQQAKSGRQTAATVDREIVIEDAETDGEIRINPAADLRNREGVSDETIAERHPELAGIDDRVRSAADRAAARELAGESKRAAAVPELVADPRDRLQTSASSDRRTANGDATRGATLDQAGAGAGPAARQAAQFDSDEGGRYKGPNLGAYVDARTLKTKRRTVEFFQDPKTTVWAVPLDDFSAKNHLSIKRLLRAIAKSDPDHFKRMYTDTKDTWEAMHDRTGSISPADRERMDRLEIARRIMAEVGVTTRVLDLEKTASQAKPMISERGRALPPIDRWDPGDYIQKQNRTNHQAYLRALRSRVHRSKNAVVRSAAAGYRNVKKGVEVTRKVAKSKPVQQTVQRTGRLVADVTDQLLR